METTVKVRSHTFDKFILPVAIGFFLLVTIGLPLLKYTVVRGLIESDLGAFIAYIIGILFAIWWFVLGFHFSRQHGATAMLSLSVSTTRRFVENRIKRIREELPQHIQENIEASIMLVTFSFYLFLVESLFSGQYAPKSVDEPDTTSALAFFFFLAGFSVFTMALWKKFWTESYIQFVTKGSVRDFFTYLLLLGGALFFISIIIKAIEFFFGINIPFA